MGRLLTPGILQSTFYKTSAFLHPDFASVMQKWQRNVQGGHRACTGVGPCRGVPPGWRRGQRQVTGYRLSRMQSGMQSPFSLLGTQISPTCRFAFDKGGSLSPAVFLLAGLAQQLADICSSSSSARFSAAEISPPDLNVTVASHLPVCLRRVG